MDLSPAKPETLRRRWRLVLLRGGPGNLLAILRDILELTRMGRAEATQKLWLAQRQGRATLLAAHRELAEFHLQRFQARGLTVALEPA